MKKTDVKKDDAALAAQLAAQRAAVIADYNTNNMGEKWIDPNRVPTEEDVKQAEKDFNDAKDELNSRTYLIADKDNAKRVAEFLKMFISNGFWTQRFYVGVINFDAYINDFLADYEKEAKELRMEYGPMQFCFLMLENYAGFGIESAKKMAEMWDEYVPIYDLFRTHVDDYKDNYSHLQSLQERVGMMAQGFYMVILTPDEKFSKESEMTTETVEATECDGCTEVGCDDGCDGCDDKCDACCDDCCDDTFEPMVETVPVETVSI